MKKILITILCVVLAVGAWLIFRPSPKPSQLVSQPSVKLKVGYLPSLAAAQLYVASAQGFFEKEGLRVEATEIYSGPEIIQALQSKSIDVGFGVLPSAILARANGVPVRSLVGVTTDSEAIQEHRIVVAKENAIKNVSDLKGKRLALVAEPTSDGLSLFEFLERYGIGRSEVTVIKLPHPEMLVAVSSGAVDAAAAIEPFISQGRLSGKTRELIFYYPPEVTEVGTYLVHDDWLRANRDVAHRFANAIKEATRWINKDQDRFRDFLLVLEQKGFQMKVSKQAAKELRPPGFLEAPSETGVENLVKLLRKYGFLKTDIDPVLLLPVPDVQ